MRWQSNRLSPTCFLVGGVAAAVGVILFATSPSSAEPKVSARPFVSPTASGLLVTGPLPDWQ